MQHARNASKSPFVALSPGQGKIIDRTFRVGHMGLVDENDIREVLSAIKAVLPKVGFVPAGV